MLVRNAGADGPAQFTLGAPELAERLSCFVLFAPLRVQGK